MSSKRGANDAAVVEKTAYGMAVVISNTRRSASKNNLNGFGTGVGGGCSQLVSLEERPIMGIIARFHLEGGIEPFPTRLRSVSGKNLRCAYRQ